MRSAKEIIISNLIIKVSLKWWRRKNYYIGLGLASEEDTVPANRLGTERTESETNKEP